MKISELVEKLKEIQEQHGDLRCLTPGFDEAGAENVHTVEVRQVKWHISKPGLQGGRHEYVPKLEELHPADPSCLVVNIDWDFDF